MGVGQQKRLAMLVDAENANPGLLRDILDEASRHGTVTVRRIYGNWTQKGMENW